MTTKDRERAPSSPSLISNKQRKSLGWEKSTEKHEDAEERQTHGWSGAEQQGDHWLCKNWLSQPRETSCWAWPKPGEARVSPLSKGEWIWWQLKRALPNPTTLQLKCPEPEAVSLDITWDFSPAHLLSESMQAFSFCYIFIAELDLALRVTAFCVFWPSHLNFKLLQQKQQAAAAHSPSLCNFILQTLTLYSPWVTYSRLKSCSPVSHRLCWSCS